MSRQIGYEVPMIQVIDFSQKDVIKCSGLTVTEEGTGGGIDYSDFEWGKWF